MLDVGAYPTQPRQLGMVQNLEQARVVEAQRLANFVPTPSDIDPAFVHTKTKSSNIFINPADALSSFVSTDRFAEVAPDFIGGFSTIAANRPNDSGLQLFNAVMIFPEERQATAAAAALEGIDLADNPGDQAVQIPQYPAAHAHWTPGKQSMSSWYATGKLVILTWIYDNLKVFLKKADLPALISAAVKCLDTMVPSVAKFTPTPADQLMKASRDFDGMLGRTLQLPAVEESWSPAGVYDERAAIHFSSEPAKVRKAIEEHGVDKYARDGNELYRATDAAAAKQVSADLGGPAKPFRGSDPPHNLPIAQCVAYAGSNSYVTRYYCTVSYGRYAAFSSSNQLLDAQQRIAAQYALLVNAE